MTGEPMQIKGAIGTFLTIAVTSIISAGFRQIIALRTFNILFPLYWALGLVG